MLARASLLMLALTLSWGLSACRRDADPEAEIRASIDAMVAAAELRDLGAFMDGVDSNYADDLGQTRADIFIQAQLYFGPGQVIRVTHRTADVVVTDDRATARVIAGVADGPITDADRRADVVEFQVVFVRDGQDWLVRSASWTHSNVAALLGA